MLYPGQVVWIPADNTIGIYIDFSPAKTSWGTPDLVVFKYSGKDGIDSETIIYEPSDLEPLAIPSKTSLTKQIGYVGKHQRESLSDTFNDEDLAECQTDMLTEMATILRSKWFKARYKIQKEPTTTTK